MRLQCGLLYAYGFKLNIIYNNKIKKSIGTRRSEYERSAEIDNEKLN